MSTFPTISRRLIFGTLTLSCVAGCKSQFHSDSVNDMRAYLSAPENGLLCTRLAQPFILSLQYLPAAYLAKVQGQPVIADTSSNQLVTFQLRVASSTQTVSVTQLLAERAPAEWTAFQRQQALYHGFEQLCRLQLGSAVVEPLFATVEMTTQQQRELSVLLVFPLSVRQLRQQPQLQLQLKPSYFLREPVAFSYHTADLLAVIPD